MCTAISYKTEEHYFGRNLDLHHSYKETVTVTPRHFPFHFRNGTVIENHYALIGMANVNYGYPLYYEATNEAGLSLAGLNFPQNAVYCTGSVSKENITPFELIPWLLGQCKNTSEALQKIDTMNLWNCPFSDELPLTPLHWMISDRDRSFTIESMADGLKIYENSPGVLTNNPPFYYHIHNLSNYINLTCHQPSNRFSDKIALEPYSLGMGAIGLPGDLSSQSRFIRAAFTKLNSVAVTGESESISQFFHILASVAQQKGLNCVGNGEYEYTIYSSCCNTDRGIYYYTTYENSQITAVDMYKEDLDTKDLISYPLITGQQVLRQN
ncbi:MAG: choloylglycine hydrolase family protein [Ruminococcaceae bacterium]|nr:choloylglycine hydrolase family protein [Oscillospiraceae bacterium]